MENYTFVQLRYTPYKFGVEKSLPDNSDYYISNYGYFYDYYGSKYVFLDRKGGRFLLWENGAMNLSIVSSNQYYTIGELKDFSTLYMGQSCKKTLFALMKIRRVKYINMTLGLIIQVVIHISMLYLDIR